MNTELAESAIRCTTDDGADLHVRCWSGEASAKALAVVVHGIVEHSGRYAEMAAAFNRAGITVWAADNRGHGRSSAVVSGSTALIAMPKTSRSS